MNVLWKKYCDKNSEYSRIYQRKTKSDSEFFILNDIIYDKLFRATFYHILNILICCYFWQCNDTEMLVPRCDLFQLILFPLGLEQLNNLIELFVLHGLLISSFQQPQHANPDVTVGQYIHSCEFQMQPPQHCLKHWRKVAYTSSLKED